MTSLDISSTELLPLLPLHTLIHLLWTLSGSSEKKYWPNSLNWMVSTSLSTASAPPLTKSALHFLSLNLSLAGPVSLLVRHSELLCPDWWHLKHTSRPAKHLPRCLLLHLVHSGSWNWGWSLCLSSSLTSCFFFLSLLSWVGSFPQSSALSFSNNFSHLSII